MDVYFICECDDDEKTSIKEILGCCGCGSFLVKDKWGDNKREVFVLQNKYRDNFSFCTYPGFEKRGLGSGQDGWIWEFQEKGRNRYNGSK